MLQKNLLKLTARQNTILTEKKEARAVAEIKIKNHIIKIN